MKTYSRIPRRRPRTPLLDGIAHPADLRSLELPDLQQLADELRACLLHSVGISGGHFGAGLGVVELCVALHRTYSSPHDRMVWDVGHQAYPHKILTGRRHAMSRVRQRGGPAPFLSRGESEHDCFGAGHSSTSISAALGMALAAHSRGEERKHLAIIGDGAMTAGMAFEALNHCAQTRADLLVVLNDNQMSIARNVGGMASYLSRIWASRLYNQIRHGGKKVLSRVPSAFEFVRRAEEHMKGLVSPGTLFEEMGFNYIGPLDGHNIELLCNTLENLRQLREPVLLHCITQKGRGFAPAEKDPVGYHALGKISPAAATDDPPGQAARKYQDIFGDWLCDTAAADERLVAITPAMGEGSGMTEFARRWPQRYQDVAIAEQHALTLAAGLAAADARPVVAIYSTFLQRAYDQLIHDIALQNLNVLLAIDRAGPVGEDGPTHCGNFDLSFLRCIPNLVIAAPSDERELRLLLSTAYHHRGPACVRYPRGQGQGVRPLPSLGRVAVGRARVRSKMSGKDGGPAMALLAFGTALHPAHAALPAIRRHARASLYDMRFVKPLDERLLAQLAAECQLLVTLEENAVAGGAGSAVAEYLHRQGRSTPLLQLGIPDAFCAHGSRAEQLADAGLDPASIAASIAATTKRL